MKILITGAYGIVGSYLCKELKNEHEIIGIGRRKKYDVWFGGKRARSGISRFNRVYNGWIPTKCTVSI